MNYFLSKVVAIILAFTVMFSSSFVIVETHCCNGEEIDSSILGSADVCDMDMSLCSLEDSSSISESKCCNNILDFKFATVFNTNHHKKSNFVQLHFTPFFSLINTELFQPNKTQNYYSSEYSPPIMIRDIYILNEHFLI